MYSDPSRSPTLSGDKDLAYRDQLEVVVAICSSEIVIASQEAITGRPVFRRLLREISYQGTYIGDCP